MTDTLIITEKNLQLCTFWLNNKLFAVNITDVKEVDADIKFTPVFHATEMVNGYVNIRGSIFLIVDMRRLMGFKSKKPDSLSRVILFKQTMGESFGILVDQIGDVLMVDRDKIENINDIDANQINGNKGINYELSKGVYKLDDSLLVILKTENILKAIEN